MSSLRSTGRRTIAALAIYASLLGPWTDFSSIFGRFLELLSQPHQNASMSDGGCVIDPNGKCVEQPAPPPTIDGGCVIDPDGCSN